jgi:hypothetical protein
MTRRTRFVLCGLGVVLLAAVLGTTLFVRRAHAQSTGYEGLLLCSMPGATKAEALSATGINTLFAQTFTVRTRNWRWLADVRLWHGEWWLRDASGTFSWVPVGTALTCSYYPSTLNEDWIHY